MSDPQPLVVVAETIDPSAVAELKSGPCRVVEATAGESELTPQLAEAWGIVVRSRTKVTAAFLTKAPKLKLVARAGVGVDNVDVAACTERGVRVVNTPTAATASVAEVTIGLYLMLARNLYERIRATKAGEWKRSELGTELEGKTVGFVGYGRIAREIARRLQPFRVQTIAHDPFIPAAVDATELLPLDTVLARADFVSLHAALTPENHHLLNTDRLARMKRGSYLVNVARGPLVDEEALLAALESGHLAGAALDVFETEPPTRTKLLQHPRLLPTPHLGASTHEAQQRAGRFIVGEVLHALRGEPLQSLVNPAAGGPR
ncbi:MAG TPA: hydroxyacid dehydrogenase [Thermoplasmata archaeon]|nr:hydroxyacid dehydrogenase [Thermoplasmata archaeon]